MTCPSEGVLATHADRELPPEAARQTEAHLLGCPRCRELLEALRGESRLLAATLERAPEPQTAEGEVPLVGRVAMALVAFGVAASVQAGWSWLGTLGEQSPIHVVDERSLAVSALFEAVFFLLREGASMLTSLLKIIVAVLLVAVAGVALAFWRRRTPSAILLAALLALAASPSFALERRVGDKEGVVIIPAGETIDDSLLAAGDTVSVDGVVTGNVLAFGRRVSVRGTVKGDLVTFARIVDVDGTVEGNILNFSEDFAARGPVAQSLHAVAKHVGIEREARIRGDAITLSQEVDLEGQVGRDLFAFAGLANLRGNVARNASTWTERLRVEAPARIGGDLTAHVEQKDRLTVDSGATVVGKTTTVLGDRKARSTTSRYSHPSFYFWRVIWLAAAFLTGLVLRGLLPSLFPHAFGSSAAVGKALGIGVLALAAPPVIVVILAVTLVGLPLALLGLVTWLAGLYISRIVVAALLGRLLLSRRDAPTPPFALALIVGLLAVTVATNIPYLGGIASLIVLPLGLGESMAQLIRSRRAHFVPEVAETP
ncbi:MAG: zf-HC2 domain-containing protein [Vicinamibacteria bacterium]